MCNIIKVFDLLFARAVKSEFMYAFVKNNNCALYYINYYHSALFRIQYTSVYTIT